MVIFLWVNIILTAGVVGYLGYGGYRFWSARENLEQRDDAKNHLLIGAICAIVIIVLWLIYILIARQHQTHTNTNTNTNQSCPGGNCLTTSGGTFNLTGVTSCAVRPNYAANVARTSAIALTFNADLKAPSVTSAVTNAPANAPKLVIEQCDDQTCAKPTTPKAVANQTVSGASATGKSGAAKAEWVVKNNVVVFYHNSFSTDPSSNDNLWFAPSTWYRVTIPKGTASDALHDLRDRVLAKCEKTSGEPIEGDHCVDKGDRILWTFQTGTGTGPQSLTLNQTVPSSTYLTNTNVTPEQDLSRTPIIGFDLNQAVDPSSISNATFQVTKLATDPNPLTGQGGKPGTTPVSSDNYTVRVNSTGTGAWFQLKDGQLLDPFSWYQVTVAGVQSLCGSGQAFTTTWVFQTTDVAPGVSQVYPRNGFQYACPTTKVFIQYNTPMWKIDGGSDDCTPGTPGSAIVDSGMTKANGRTLSVMDPFDVRDPNHSCTSFAFGPTSASLAPTTTYSAGVNSSRQLADGSGQLNYGDTPPAKTPSQGPWSFSVVSPETCVQPPVITRVAPAQGQNGQCVTVLGDYFEKKSGNGFETDGQNTGDLLSLGGITQTSRTWLQNAIVSSVNSGTLPASQAATYKVTVNYPAPVGPQDSNTVKFQLQAGAAGAGPCLDTLSSYRGPAGVTIGATGTHFSPYTAGSSAILSSRYTAGWSVDSSKWSDTAIGPNAITVNAQTPVGDGLMSVRDNAGRISNPLPYTVTTAGSATASSVPQINTGTACNMATNTVPSPNPVDGDGQACVNAVATAKFTVAMDIKTLNSGNIYLEQCSSTTTCQRVPATVTAYPTSFVLKPTAKLVVSTKYRVTVTTGVKSAKGVTMTTPYSWSFTTGASANDCPISSVAIAEPWATFRSSYRYPLHAVVTDQTCHTLSPGSLTYAWTTSNASVAALIAKDTASDNVASGPAKSSATGDAQITVSTQGKSSAAITLSYQPTRCTTDTDCATNGLGESCPASRCVNNACSPVVNGLEPNNGAPGTWTTIKGCWFGGFVDGKSAVTFANGQASVVPDPGICGETWTNERIVREVPAGAVSGALSVVRADGQKTSTATFTVNSSQHPNICKVNPGDGQVGSGLTVIGSGFGTSAATGDAVQFIHDAATVPSTNILSWKTGQIDTTIPAAAVPGDNDVRVQKGTNVSNPWPLAVLDSSGNNPDNPDNGGGGPDNPPGDIGPTPGSCTICSAGSNTCSSGQGCGYDGCCHDRPVETSISPSDKTNICRNTEIRIGFSLPLDGSSVNDSSVIYRQGADVLSGVASVENSESDGAVVIQPGSLKGNTAQSITMTTDIRGETGAPVILNTNPIGFTTGSAICSIDHVDVVPPTTRFTSAAQSQVYTAQAIASDGSVISPSNDLTWNWSWETSDASIATVSGNGASGTVQPASPAKNGTATITATATPTKSNGIAGTAEAVVDFCAAPWTGGGLNTSRYGFGLYYCPGTDLLTLSYATSADDTTESGAQRLLTSYFYKENSSGHDAIGIRIQANTDNLTPATWIAKKFPTVTGGQSVVVGGYLAVKIGTTTYVGFSHVVGNRATSYMMVLDYNSNNAQGPMASVFQALVDHLVFNTNLAQTDGDKLAADSARMQALGTIENALQSYHASNGTYPALPSGSYLTNFTTSAWPSWQQTLGASLGITVPTDPTNTFTTVTNGVCSLDAKKKCTSDADCGSAGACRLVQCVTDPAKNLSYDSASCWSDTLRSFQCPSGSSVLGYQSNGASYHLYANFQTNYFAHSGSINPCTSPSSCSCFNFDSLSP